MSTEARIISGFGILCIVAGLTWLFGAIGLLASGVLLAIFGLFVIDVGGGTNAESMEGTPQRGIPVRGR